ncbi:MAG: hypothetical protein F6K24_35760 [Okeania sp. SIO2D1]|nr:hypothetical protein [Okeania sp. SIO2D1]
METLILINICTIASFFKQADRYRYHVYKELETTQTFDAKDFDVDGSLTMFAIVATTFTSCIFRKYPFLLILTICFFQILS